MDKYKKAIVEHEVCRKEIIRLTKAIGNASGNCSNYKGEFPISTYCIERYWQDNNDKKAALDCGAIELGSKELLEKVHLCPSCSDVDRLVIERKEMKQRFGIAKKRIGQLARNLVFIK